MGIYSFILLFIGILIVGLLYAKTYTKGIKHLLLFALILGIFLFSFFMIHHHFQKTCLILGGESLLTVEDLIRSWGVAGPIVSILLMMIQAVIAPIPAFLITGANGMIFGLFWGGIISWIGAMSGALTTYYLSRSLDKVAIEKVLKNQKAYSLYHRIGGKSGFLIILLARLLPFISFDIISYAAGLSGVKPRSFLLATGLGMLPATIAYTVIGNKATTVFQFDPRLTTISVVILFIIVVFIGVQGLKKQN